jgi:hypothetical protein
MVRTPEQKWKPNVLPRVFIVNETLRRGDDGKLGRSVDLSPALEFGQLLHLLPAGQPPDDPLTMIRTVENNLAINDFCQQDLLLLMGSPVAIGVAMVLASRRNGGPVSVLKWVARDHRYQKLTLPLPETAFVD